MKRLLILSGKGGTGKTTTASSFIKFSNAKAMADCDVDAPNLHIVTELRGDLEKSDFLGGDKAFIDTEKCVKCGLCKEKCRFDAIEIQNSKYIVNEYNCEGCGVCEYVCPQKAIALHEDVAGEMRLYKGDKTFSTATLKMSRGNSGKLVSKVKLNLFKNAPETPICIVDGSPGIGCPVIASISGMDMALVVAEPSVSGINDLERLVKTAESLGTRLAVCVNKYDQNESKTEEIEDFCKENNIPFVGKIPYDKTASKAINQGKSVADIECKAKNALFEIYNNVIKII